MKPAELVKKAMERARAASGAELGAATGIDRRRIADYAKNERWPDNTHARLLAEAAGLPWAEVIAELEIERASDEATRTAWGKALATIRGTVAALLVAVAVLAVTGFGGAEVGPLAGVYALVLLLIIFIM